MSNLTYEEFMVSMLNAPWDYKACEDCGGVGLKPVLCCYGLVEECGCMSMPTDYIICGCSADEPTVEQIKAWANIL